MSKLSKEDIEIADRLTEAYRAKEAILLQKGETFSYADFAEACGWPRSAKSRISNYINKIRGIRKENIPILAKGLGIDPMILQHGEKPSIDKNQFQMQPIEAFVNIPLIKLSDVQNWLQDKLPVSSLTHIKVPIMDKNKQLGSKSFIIKVQDDAMVSIDHKKSILPDEMIIFDPDAPPVANKVVLAETEKGNKIRLLSFDGEEKLLKPNNDKYATIPFDEAKVLAIGIYKLAEL